MYEHEPCFLFVLGFVQQETSTSYRMMCNVAFVVFWGTLLRPTAGAVLVVPIRKSTTVQHVPWLCARRKDEQLLRAPSVGRHNCSSTQVDEGRAEIFSRYKCKARTAVERGGNEPTV